MYEFVSGPLVWIAFAGFFAGVTYKVIDMARLARKEKVVLPTMDAKYGLRSLLHWIVPFAGRKTQLHPIYTAISYAFHICLLITPLFLMGHAVMWQKAWGIRWWSLPESVADIMTLLVIFACLFFIVRRLIRPEVRNVSYPSDFLLAVVVMAPFVTGFVAHHQWLPYRPVLIVHMTSGALAMLLIPWTRLVHMIWFAFTRAYMGSEFGAVRHSRDW
jgi:nitrate reductase gamma subunit